MNYDDGGRIAEGSRQDRDNHGRIAKNCPACTNMVHAKNSLNFAFKVIANVFWNALSDAIGRNFSKK